jgi:RNA recognition motif-containing protein
MSLDDIIKSRNDEKNKKSDRKRPQINLKQRNVNKTARLAVPYSAEVKPQTIVRTIRPVQKVQAPLSVPNTQVPGPMSTNKKEGVFSRLGKFNNPSGTSVTFSNLVTSILDSDMEELCSSIGEVKDVEVIRKQGKTFSKVIFARRSDALKCVADFNGQTLDGLPMVVELTNEPSEMSAPRTVLSRLGSAPASIPANVREGLFGTDINSSSLNSSTTFSVRFDDASGRPPIGRVVEASRPFSSRGRGSGPGLGSSRMAGGGRGKGRRAPRSEDKGGNDLDADLDNYFAKK